MEHWILGSGIAMCLFSLWVLGRRDWLRLTLPSRQVLGEVIGHRAQWSEGERSYAAIYRFTGEDGIHEVVDVSYGPKPEPPIGTMRELHYPEGHQELAQPPRPVLWIAVYLLMVSLLGMLVTKAMGWLPHP